MAGWRAMAASIIWLASCASEQPTVVATDAQRERAVANWLNCDECWNRQYEHLVAFGPDVVPILLRYATGREPCETTARDTALRRTYRRILAAARGGLGESEDAFVQRHMQAYCERVKQRAAAAVDAIDPSELPRELRYQRGRQIVFPEGRPP